MTMTIPVSFEQKVSRLRVLMTEIGAGPFLADHGELMAWLTGYTVSETMYRAMLVGCDSARQLKEGLKKFHRPLFEALRAR